MTSEPARPAAGRPRAFSGGPHAGRPGVEEGWHATADEPGYPNHVRGGRAPLGGGPDLDGVDALGEEIRTQIIGPLYLSSIRLSSLASRIDDPHVVARIMRCIESIDSAITDIRSSALDAVHELNREGA